MSLENEIRNIAEEMIEKLSQVTLFEKSSKERFQDILQESKKAGEIIDFLPMKQGRYGDFLFTIIKDNVYNVSGIGVVKSKKEAKNYKKKQEKLRLEISEYRKFITRIVIIASPEISDIDIKWQWSKAIKQYQES
ncbi:MAG: hypothetical protein ABIG88_02180 [Patescibacteria group bacterium]|nr:hypothetical protein [Patescibacteria group bacterium]